MTVLGFIKMNKEKAWKLIGRVTLLTRQPRLTRVVPTAPLTATPLDWVLLKGRENASLLRLPSIPPTLKHTNSIVWFLTPFSSNGLNQEFDSMFWIQNGSTSLLHCLEHADNLVMGEDGYLAMEMCLYTQEL